MKIYYKRFNQVLRTDLFSFKSFNRMGFVVFTPIVGWSNRNLDLVLGLFFWLFKNWGVTIPLRMSPSRLLRTIVLLIRAINMFGNLEKVNGTQGI